MLNFEKYLNENKLSEYLKIMFEYTEYPKDEEYPNYEEYGDENDENKEDNKLKYISFKQIFNGKNEDLTVPEQYSYINMLQDIKYLFNNEKNEGKIDFFKKQLSYNTFPAKLKNDTLIFYWKMPHSRNDINKIFINELVFEKDQKTNKLEVVTLVSKLRDCQIVAGKEFMDVDLDNW